MSDQSIDLRDQLSIDTPELVGIELPLAGIGSRCVAFLVDSVVQGFALGALVLLIVLVASAAPPASHAARSSEPGKWAIAIVLLIPFLLQWGYFTLFEAFWRGQTPGKRLLQLRVIQQSGRPIGLFESMGRNLVRVIDMLPVFYVLGAICIFTTRRQQRLGDMVAGTIVVHSVPAEKPLAPAGTRTFTAAAFEPPPQTAASKVVDLPADAVARLSRADLQMIDAFLARRLDLPLDVGASLAEKMARGLAGKMKIEAPAGISNETFLEALALSLRDVGTGNSR
ncbi:MAG TPA: RDD family protein [Acidobacteriaceae bacterium]|nr:RDD family protein [Acidobacteriaceae bacterium]